MSNSVRISFVLPLQSSTELDCNEEMHQAFLLCKQNGMNPDWIKEDKIAEENWKKTDVLVFQNFEGKHFEKIKSKSSVRIVGAWCMLTCLTEAKIIPSVPWPVFNAAMLDCFVTCSHFSKPQKAEIKDYVQKMGGHYNENLMAVTTHLVTDTVKSEKYIKAAESGLNIMLFDWIKEVWNVSCKSNVNCNNSEFNKYRCPPFHNLIICCTGFRDETRGKIEELINTHGGLYKGCLQLKNTDFLVCEKGSSSSAKYKAAIKSKTVKCVSMDWLLNSIEKGYALPDYLYPVDGGKTSTPTKEGNVLPDFSMISTITNNSPLVSNIADTITNTMCATMNNFNSVDSKKRKSSNEWDSLVDEIDLKKVKLAGNFLDGCSIYLAGFTAERKEKLSKVLNFGGAMRYDEVSDRITHIIVGDPSCDDLKIVNNKGLAENLHILNLRWLIDSVNQKRIVSEENYLFKDNNDTCTRIGSPLSKKALFVMHSQTPTIDIPKDQDLEGDNRQKGHDENSELVKQYLQPESSRLDSLAQLLKNAEGSLNTNEENYSMTIKNDTDKNVNKTLKRNEETLSEVNSMNSESTSQNIKPFEKMKFVLTDLAEVHEDIKEKIEELGGTVVSATFRGVPNYVVAPLFVQFFKSKPSSEVVSPIYILDCHAVCELVEIKYYHRPILIDSEAKPLSDKVVTVSGFAGYERLFLKELIKELGGIPQDQFARVGKPERNIVASTHLVSLEAKGKKFEVALKWNIPVVTKDWLMRCAETGEAEPEESYLMRGTEEGTENMNSSAYKLTEVVTPGSTLLTNKKVPPQCNGLKENGSDSPTNMNPIRKSLFGKNTDNTMRESRSLTKNKTPTRLLNDSNGTENNQINTPPRSVSDNTSEDGTPKNTSKVVNEILSQVTPVSKIMEEARINNLLGTPECPPTPKPYNFVSTPDTPLGAFITPNPSSKLRKEIAQWINTLPSCQPPPPRRPSTPLSELKRKLWDKICPPRNNEIPSKIDFQSDDSQENSPKVTCKSATPLKNTQSSLPETPESLLVKNQLQQIQEMLTSSGGKNSSSKRRTSTIPETAPTIRNKNSQANTVGWDDSMDQELGNFTETPKPLIMLSGIPTEDRDIMVENLEKLGAEVSNSTNFDPKCTHLVCPKPLRNEKVLACMASGKWILHTSYVDECIKAKKLVDEELFEYGNPKSKNNANMPKDKELQPIMDSMHWWRKEILRRGYGPFNDMRAIIVATKSEPIARVIEAGGGTIVNASPPFLEPVHATHCLLEAKAVGDDLASYIPLAEQGIYCIKTVYISDYLQRTTSDEKSCVFPCFSKYYSNTTRD